MPTRPRRFLPVAGALLFALPGSISADAPPALATPVVTANAPASAPPPASASAARSRFSAALRASLPAWKPQPPAVFVIPQPGAKRDAAGREIIVLPQVTVHGPRPPRLHEDDFLTPKALDARLVKEELSDFDANFLNRFTLPIIGIPREARARALHEKRAMQEAIAELNYFNALTKTADAAAAKSPK